MTRTTFDAAVVDPVGSDYVKTENGSEATKNESCS